MIKRGKIFSKRGLSEVITSIIMVLLVLVAIVIVWVVVKNALDSSTDGISISRITIRLEIKNVVVDNSTNIVNITIKRLVGKGDVSGIKFVFTDGINSEIVEVDYPLRELEERKFNFTLNILEVENLTEISVVTILITSSGKALSGTTYTYDMKSGKTKVGSTGEEGQPPNNETNCIPVCLPNTCGSDGCNETCICSKGYLCNTTSFECKKCLSNLECDDNIDCTDDLCSNGECAHYPNNNLCPSEEICSFIEGCIKVNLPQNLVEIYNQINRTSEKRAVYGQGNNSINVTLLEDKNNNYFWQPETLMFNDLKTGKEVWRMTNSPNGFSIYFTDIGVNAWSTDGKYLTLETEGRPTQSFSNYGPSSKKFYGQMIVKTDGNSFRFLINSSNRENHWAFAWSPQIPDTYYDFGKTFGYPMNAPQTDVLYKNVVTENSSYFVPLFDANLNLNINKLISADGRKILPQGGNRTKEYFSWFYPITIYPDNKAGFDLNSVDYPYRGYSIYRNLPNYAGTDNLNQSLYLGPAYSNKAPIAGHDKYYAGDGSWFYWLVPTNGLSTDAWWRLKVIGSAADGGPYSDKSDFPVNDTNYNFGEAWPETHRTIYWKLNVTNIVGNFIQEYLNFSISGSKNSLNSINVTSKEMEISFYEGYSHPFKAPVIGDIIKGLTSGATATVVGIIYSFYPSPFVIDTTNYYSDKSCDWDHFVPDRWGRISLFSASCDYLPGSYYPNGTFKGHNYGPATWDIQEHKWIVPSFGGGASHHDWKGFSDWVVSSYKTNISAEVYNDINSKFLITNAYEYYFGGSSYITIPRPTQSPDGTKVGYHSEFLNGKDRVDSYWAVVTYPYPPTDLSATYNNGVKINFLPPKYTERGWPFANETKNKIRNGTWPELDSNNNEIGESLYAREINKFHVWRASTQTGPWNEVGNVNYLQSHVYHSSEDANNEMMMLHPVDAIGKKISPTNKMFFTDSVSDGTYYYAFTSEEHSGLESDGLSEILKVTITGGAIITQQIVSVKGQKNFWRNYPQSVTNFDYAPMNEPGYYKLTWVEPIDSKIRFYNIYYSNVSNPYALQQYRIASVRVGWNKFIDYAADSGTQGYYGITSVDRYGNEGEIIYKN